MIKPAAVASPDASPDWEDIARRAAHSMPPSDYGSTRAIRDVASLLAEAYALGVRHGDGAEHHRMELIAADLLAALRCFVDDNRFHVTVGGNPIVVPRMFAEVHAAMAKARGVVAERTERMGENRSSTQHSERRERR